MFSPLPKYAGFYQELVAGTVNYAELANRLIQLGKRSHSLRQFDTVREVGLIFSNIPVKDYQAIGYYFLATWQTARSARDIASPLARYYPEWQETLSDVRSKRKRRSTIAFSRPLIEREYEAEPKDSQDAHQAARNRQRDRLHEGQYSPEDCA